ncbi:glycosyl hydrolase family 28 protein [Planotetraspora sp. A-T 1434]|uniref:glycosyl hydrolase family 28 protein n=1 Tax=Planotetraspora sp. A-T 1434 TaxID=2979219 RepID=UPI0021C114F4|nr:glycosyl hydrolase family 28 protein [Planotetraspora sp. A-T 1434]MCT9930266.1 glycosyl hydrolase family 28 protein [Planotetraspora sp. A-T 1434]
MRYLKGLAAVLAAGIAFSGVQWTPASAAAEFNVRDYGATGNGSTNDDDAIDKAINAANAAGGGIVVFPSGNYRSRTIHLKSNVTLRLDSGSTIKAAASGMDAPESNSYSQYQDFGHSHFHNSLFWGDHVSNVGFTGVGTIEGDKNLSTSSSPPSGAANKAIALTECDHITISGITIKHGGHFALLMNGCHDVLIDHLTTVRDTSATRDALDIINSWNVEVANSNIASNDDAIAFKSDYALGHTYVSHDNYVHDTTAYSYQNNALEFGSETCGNFRDIRFENITITGGGKAGIGMVSMDGAIIENISYTNVTLSRTTTPIYFKIGDRKRCPGSPPAGRIRNITLTNVTGSNLNAPVVDGTTGANDYASTVTGTTSVDIGPGITFNNVNLTVPGAHPASDATKVPGEFLTSYPPRDYGTRPSYGYWIRHATGVKVNGGTLKFSSNDDRPAIIADDASTVVVDGLTAQRGSASPYDVGVSNVTGYAVTNSQNTSGGALRVKATNSTPLPSGPPPTRYEAENATISQGIFETLHPGFSGTGYVNLDNIVGSYLEYSVTAAQAGNATIAIRYANGTTVNRPMDIAVNGTVVAAGRAFNPTTNWDTWDTSTLTVPLNAGSNTIRLTSTTANGGPNLDYLDVSQ